MNNIKICYAYELNPGYDDDQTKDAECCKKLFEDVFSSLRPKLKDLGEEIAAAKGFDEVEWDSGNFDLIVGDPVWLHKQRGKKFHHPVPTLLLLQGDVWGEEVSAVLKSPQFDVIGIFRTSRLWPEKNRDIEDVSALTVILKNLVRHVLRSRQKDGKALVQEEDLSKAIDWKAKLPVKRGSGFVSLFSDPSTQHMASAYKDALLSLNRPIFSEIRTSVPEFMKLNREDKTDGRLAQYRTNMARFLESRKEIKAGKSGRKHLEERQKQEAEKLIARGMHIPSLLLLGETGCGKSLLAQASADVLSDGFFSRANISAYPENSIDGFLFGSVYGSYTGSQEDLPGIFIASCGGTVFLDEIGDMSPASQTRLLTYMDDGRVQPLGMAEPIFAPCILIAATNKDITNKDINKKSSKFRQDIVHRFDHIITIPPLRERKQDLRLLISLTLQNESVNPPVDPEKPEERRVSRISLDAIKLLEDYNFPGNFRELEFILRQAVNNAFADRNSCICVRHISISR